MTAENTGYTENGQYVYYIYNVFTRDTFGGNPLAVIPDAIGLTDKQMQQIARQFNFSESTFVLPPASADHHKHVRIFTPSREVPFAGHPNIGTACALVEQGDVILGIDEDTVFFDEAAGTVPVTLSREERADQSALIQYALQAPESFTISSVVETEHVAQALGLTIDDINTQCHQPLVASVGLPFVFVEVNSMSALQRAKVVIDGFDRIHETGVMPDIHVYYRSRDEFDVRTRMFAPLDGVWEDPATGSANSALAALLVSLHEESDGDYQLRIAQGIEMGRPSELIATATKEHGEITRAGVKGTAVKFARGVLSV